MLDWVKIQFLKYVSYIFVCWCVCVVVLIVFVAVLCLGVSSCFFCCFCFLISLIVFSVFTRTVFQLWFVCFSFWMVFASNVSGESFKTSLFAKIFGRYSLDKT